MRTHEGPVPIRLDPLHEEVGDPEGVEEVAGAVLLLARVLLAVEEVKDVCMPRLQIDGKRPGALTTTTLMLYRVHNFVKFISCLEDK